MIPQKKALKLNYLEQEGQRRDFWLETRVIIKISTHPWYPRNFDQFSWRWCKKIQNGRLKKTEFFKNAIFQKKIAKISWIGPWVSSIAWCESHWCGLTYMVMRLSKRKCKNSLKTQKMQFLPVFEITSVSLMAIYVEQHNVALHINQFYWPKHGSMKGVSSKPSGDLIVAPILCF